MNMIKQGKRLDHQQCEGRTDIVNKFPSVFKGHGTLPYTYKIQLKDDAKPVVHTPRRVAAPLRAGLKKELERMTQISVQNAEVPLYTLCVQCSCDLNSKVQHSNSKHAHGSTTVKVKISTYILTVDEQDLQ